VIARPRAHQSTAACDEEVINASREWSLGAWGSGEWRNGSGAGRATGLQRRSFEAFVFAYLAGELRTGDIAAGRLALPPGYL
jgi:hypothetical protein